MYEIITAGGVVGEMALIDEGAPRNASILAATYAELWEINTDKFRSMVTGNPDFALMIMRDGAASPDHEPALSPHSASTLGRELEPLPLLWFGQFVHQPSDVTKALAGTMSPVAGRRSRGSRSGTLSPASWRLYRLLPSRIDGRLPRVRRQV